MVTLVPESKNQYPQFTVRSLTMYTYCQLGPWIENQYHQLTVRSLTVYTYCQVKTKFHYDPWQIVSLTCYLLTTLKYMC